MNAKKNIGKQIASTCNFIREKTCEQIQFLSFLLYVHFFSIVEHGSYAISRSYLQTFVAESFEDFEDGLHKNCVSQFFGNR